jgi:hypothetical protein
MDFFAAVEISPIETITETEVDDTEVEFEEVSEVKIVLVPNKNKAELLDQYMMIVDSEYLCDKKKNGDKIRKCGRCNVEKILMHTDGMYVCQICGEVDIVIVDSEKPNYKEAVTSDTKPGYPYKRITLFSTAGYHKLAVWSYGKIVEIL